MVQSNLRRLRVSSVGVLLIGAGLFVAATVLFSTDEAILPAEAFVFAALLVAFPAAVLASFLFALGSGGRPSAAGVLAGLWGVEAFVLPRLWIATAHLVGEGASTDFTLVAFWVLAWVGLVYLPAIVAALAKPSAIRVAVLLGVATVTQAGAVLLSTGPGMEITSYLAFPATLLLLIGARTSFTAWREAQRTRVWAP